MKFINYLERITGVGIFPLTSLIIFFVFFSVLLLWVFTADKKYMSALGNIPFDGNSENEQ